MSSTKKKNSETVTFNKQELLEKLDTIVQRIDTYNDDGQDDLMRKIKQLIFDEKPVLVKIKAKLETTFCISMLQGDTPISISQAQKEVDRMLAVGELDPVEIADECTVKVVSVKKDE